MPFPATLLRRLLALLLLLTLSARAHESFEITTAARVRAAALEMQITMTRATAHAIAFEDAGEPQSFDPKRFKELQPQLLAAARHLYWISSHGHELAPSYADVSLTVENDVEYRLEFPRPEAGPLALDFLPLNKLPEGYGNALNLTQDDPPAVLSFTLLTAAEPGVTVSIASSPGASSAATTPTGEKPAEPMPPPLFKKFLNLGIEHILTGYDHLLFLAGLLVVTRHARRMIGIITCFTLAHSITLALAALDLVALSSRVVEPLIAASIVFVGVENLLTRGEPKYRWALTFAFGLVHGFGFASVLRGLGLGAKDGFVAVPLFAFNLGVELGQLFVAALALPILLKLHQRGALGNHVARAASLLIVLCGAWWLLERTLLA